MTELRDIQVPEPGTLFEEYTETTRAFETSVTVTVTIEGDGSRLSKTAQANGQVFETQFNTVHGTSQTFTGTGGAKALLALRGAIEAQLVVAVAEWNAQRAQVLLAQSNSVNALTKAAVLTERLPAQLITLLEAKTGLTAQEAAVLVPPHQAKLVLPRFDSATTADLVLPQPDADLNQRLFTYESKVAVVSDKEGTFAGLQLGVLAAESTDGLGELRLGFGGALVGGWRPLFSVQSPFLLRAVGNLQAGSAGFFQFDAAARAEVGLDVFPVQIALLGIAQLHGTIQLKETDVSRRYFSPIVFSGGYGLKLQVSPVRFDVAVDDKALTSTIGVEVLAFRLHRTLQSAPIGSRAEVYLFYDLGSIVKLTLGLKMNANADVLQFFTSPTHLALFSLGLQSDF